MARVSSEMRRIMSRAMRIWTVCSARARREAIWVCQLGCVKALAGISQSAQRSCSCQRSSLESRVRMSNSRSRYKASWRISRSGPASRAVGRFSTPSRNPARAIASASIRSDFPACGRQASAGHQLRRQTHRGLAPVDQEPLQRSGDIADVFDRPYPLDIERAGPLQQLPVPDRPGRRGAVLDLDAELIDRRGSMGLLVRIDSDRHRLLVPSSMNPMKRTPWRKCVSRGAAALLSVHARTSSTATGDNFTNRSGPSRGTTKAERVSPKPSRTIHYTRAKRNAPPASH